MGKVFRTAAVVAAATCALLLAACGGTTVVTSGEGGQQMNTITVNATAEVKVVPDRASIQVGVTTQGATADEAEAANAQLMDAVLAALSEQGVAEDSVQTAWTNLSPMYGFADDPVAYSEEPVADDEAFVETTGAYTEVWNVGGNDIVGYEMTTELSVSDLTVEQVGAVIQAVVNAGANQVDGVSYYSSTYDEAYAEALGQAVENARPKGETIASAAGVSLGNVVQVTEGYQNRMYNYQQVTYAEEDAAEAGSAKAIAVAPGTVSIEATVTVTYAIG